MEITKNHIAQKPKNNEQNVPNQTTGEKRGGGLEVPDSYRAPVVLLE